MIKHIVCHNIPNKADAQKAAKMLNGLMGEVPALRSMCAGVDALDSPRSYSLGIVAEFDDLEGLSAYDNHEKHVAIKRFIAEVKDDSRPSVACDFEF